MTLDQFIRENDSKPQADRLSNVAIAEKFNTSEASVRRHRKVLNSGPKKDEFFQVPLDAITSRGASIRTADGSWQKITYSPIRAELTQVHSLEDVNQVFERHGAAPRVVEPVAHDNTFVISLSDFQVAKVDSLGGTPELIDRILSVYDQIESHLTRNTYPQIIISDTGDVLEGFGNTVQQAQLDDLSLTDQLRTAQKLIAEGVRRFSRYATDVVYVAVSSNHCAVRTGIGSKNRSNAPGDDFGLLVQENIRQILEDRPEYAHVRFVHPEPWEESCVVECLDGTVIGFTHGHLAGKAEKLGEWFGKQAFGHRSGLHEADALLAGHFHSFSVSLSGDNRFVIVSPTMDNGSSWYSNATGAMSDPAVLTFEAAKHRVSDWTLWYPNKGE